MPHPNPSNAEWQAMADDVTAQFEAVFADSDAYLGKAGKRLLAKALKSVSLKSYVKVGYLTELLVLADLSGRHDVFLAGADALSKVPFTGNVDIYEGIRQIHCGAVRRCELNGQPSDRFNALIGAVEADSHQGREYGQQLIRQRANGLLLRPPSKSDAATGPPRAHHLALVAQEVLELYLMWVFGGGPDWSRELIDAEIDEARNILRRVQAIV